MQTRVVQFEPWVLPVIEFHGKYVVDLKLGHFRELSSPYEAIEFGSERGRQLCAAVGVVRCNLCGMAIMVSTAVKPSQVSCVRCRAAADDSENKMEIGNGSERNVLVAES